MAENRTARVGVPAAERQTETLSSAPATVVVRELDGAVPEVGTAPVVAVDTMVARLQLKEAVPLARRAALIEIQAHYGNRYAEQVVAGLRARDEQGPDGKQGIESGNGASAADADATGRTSASASRVAAGSSPSRASGLASGTGTGAVGGAGSSERVPAGGRSARAPPTKEAHRPPSAESAAARFGVADRSTEGRSTLQRAALNFVSESSDPAEREADATARRVMRMPVPGGAGAPDPPIPPDGRRHEAGKIDRKPSGKSAVPGPVATGISDGLPSGKPLPGRVRGDMEPRFNADFSRVRVHTGTNSAELNRAVGARAFTVGHHVFFGQNQYQPESPGGRELIAHELTHTIQQGASPQGGAIQRSEAPGVAERSERKVQRLGIGDALDYFAEKAYLIPGFRMFTIIIGVNPINMSDVDRSAANILRALIEFMPGGGLITMALDNYGVFEKAGAWIEEQIAALAMTGSSIRQAIMDFLDSLSWTDIFDLGGVWQRAKRIFTEPIDRIIAFAAGVVDAIIELIKEAILRPLAELAQGWAGYDLLRGVLGFDPITGDDVERTPDLLIGGFMKMIGQEEVWNNIRQANAIDRAWAWFQGALAGVLAFVASIPTLFVEALKALRINDIVELPTVVGRVIGIFTDAIGQFGAWAFQQVVGLLQIIFEVVAPGVMPYIQRAAGAFRTILEDPIGFVRNLVRAGIQGFNQFAANFLGHLRTSLIEWLTGTLSGAGVYIPQAFSLEEIIKFVLSVLGLTWQNIREKLVRRIGEPAVVALETGFDIVVTLVREGPAAAWEKIVEAISNLREMVMEQIMTFVSERIVQAAITRLVTSLNPAGAFIQAIIAIYNTVMFFIERLRQIAQVAMAFIDSIAAIASGVIGEAASRVERTMAGLLTLVISFLARLVGLGRVSDAVANIIDRVRTPVDNALERVIDWIITMARRVGGFIAQAGVPQDPDERIKAGKEAALSAVNRFAGRPIGGSVLAPLLTAIKVRYGFSRLEAVPREGRWHVVGEINPSFDEVTESLTPEGLASEEGETLLLGEGNFSFAYSIAAETKMGDRLIATDFMVQERRQMKMTKTEEARNRLVADNIAKLEEMGVQVVRQVDATNPANYPSGSLKFIVFNHPFVPDRTRGGEGRNVQLIRDFLAAAKQRIATGGEIIIISSQYRLSRWKLDEIAAELNLEQKVRSFVASAYPEYTHEQTISGESAPVDEDQFAISFSISASVTE